MVSWRSRQRSSASDTSSTQTGWKRASTPASGITGNTDCSAANRLRKLSPAPKITDGRSTLSSSGAACRIASASALLRR